MKVLIFANIVPSRYSAYEILLEEVHKAARNDGDVVVPVLGGEPCAEVAEKWQAAGLQWDVLEGWTDADGQEHPWVFPVAARGLCRKHRPDVAAVHFGNELPSIAARLICGREIKWIWEQDQQIQAPGLLASKVSRIGLVGACFDRIISMYEGGRRSLLARGVRGDKVSVIYNSIRDYVSEPVNIRAELKIAKDSIILFSTSSLIKRKRVERLVSALAKVRSSTDKDVNLVIAGSGVEEENLLRQTEALGVGAKVHLLGMRRDVRDILPSIDIYVHSSVAETCTYSVTEAMCAGKPVVMTDAGAAREQIEDGVTGCVLGKDDSDGFVGRLVELIRHRERRISMGQAGRERWRKMFRVEDAARKYVEVYREIACSL